jgi:glutamate racemase
MSPTSPIVVLDSGLGGLTVVKAIRAALPHERLVYFGDTARLPYGNKSAAAVTGFVREILSFVRPLQPKHVVFACNTATALAMPALRAAFPELTFSGVIEPGAKAAAAAAGAKERPTIGVIATEATVRSKAYERAIHRRRGHARLLLQPAPSLAPLIEEGRDARDPLLRLALKQYLAPLIKRNIDVLVLGCTHYPVLKGLVARMMGEGVAVIDSADRCADDVARRLGAAGLLHPGGDSASANCVDAPIDRERLRCFVTDDAERFASLAPRFLGARVATPEVVSPERLHAATERDGQAFRQAG